MTTLTIDGKAQTLHYIDESTDIDALLAPYMATEESNATPAPAPMCMSKKNELLDQIKGTKKSKKGYPAPVNVKVSNEPISEISDFRLCGMVLSARMMLLCGIDLIEADTQAWTYSLNTAQAEIDRRAAIA